MELQTFTLCGRNQDGSDSTPQTLCFVFFVLLCSIGCFVGGSYLMSNEISAVGGGILISFGILLFLVPFVMCAFLCRALGGLGN